MIIRINLSYLPTKNANYTRQCVVEAYIRDPDHSLIQGSGQTGRTMELNSVMKPITVASQVMGLNVEGRLGRGYTLLVFVIVTLILYASFVRISNDKTEVLTSVDDLILWTQFGSHTLFVAVVLGCCLVRPRCFLFPIQDMLRVDSVFRSFGVKISDKYLRRTQLLQIFSLLLIPNFISAKNIYEIVTGASILSFFHWLHYSYASTLSMITDCLFVNYLSVVRKRFDKLNQLLRVLVRRNFKSSSLEVSVPFVVQRDDYRERNRETMENVDAIRLLHHDLCSISKKVNRSFGLQQLVSTTISLIMTTGQLYEAYHFIMSDVNLAQIAFTKIMTMMCYVGRLIYVSHACSRTSEQAGLASSIIHEIPLHRVSSSVTLQIQHFCIQLLDDNLNFDACGFFTIDFTLLRSIVGVVTTYLVILIQIDRKTQCAEPISHSNNSSVLN